MAESVLDAEVRIATADAYQNLQILRDASNVSSESIERMRDSVAMLDDKLKMIETTLTEATKDFQDTGSAIDGLRMAEAATKAEQYRTALANLKDRAKEVEQQILNSATAQSTYNKALVEGEKQTNLVSSATDRLASSAQNMLLSYASINSVIRLLKELEEQTKRTIDARRQLGEEQVSQDETIQSAAERLGLSGQVGINRTRAIIDRVSASAGGIDVKKAASLVASAQAAGFGVVKEGQADLSGGTADILRDVGLFARRKRLDEESTTTLFRLLENAGARSPKQVQGALATIESELQQSAMLDPQRGISTAIKAVSNRMAQGLELPQAIASVSAASIGAATPERAAQNVERLSRAAAGETDKQRLFLGQQALAAGLITPDMLKAQQAALAPQFADQTASMQKAQDQLAKGQQELAEINRAEQNRLSDMADKQRKAAAQAELLKTQIEHAKPQQRPALEERLAQNQDMQAKLARDATEAATKTGERRQQVQNNIAEQQQRLQDLQTKGGGKLEDAALKEAYASLPLAQREQFLMNATRGLNPQQVAEFVRNIAQGRAANDLIRQLSPQAQEAYNRALTAGAKPDVGGFEERNTAYLGTDVARREQARAQAQRSAAREAPAGQTFANDLETSADADIKILRSKGEGQVGNIVQLGMTFNAYNRTTNAGTEEGLKAVRMMLILRGRFERFISTMSPAQRQRRDKRIQELWTKLADLYSSIIGGYEGTFQSGQDRLIAVQKLASEIGQFMDVATQEALQKGEQPGIISDMNESLPAQHMTDKVPLEISPTAPTGSLNATGGAGAAGGSGGLPAGGSGGRAAGAAGGGSQQQRAGGAVSQVNYNISVGTMVSGNADIADLPPKLSGDDLA